MSRIFISYRRDDTAADMTDRVYERLVQRWGRRVFMDIDSIVGGDLFAQAIDDNLKNCAVVLVMIGRSWVSLTDDKGARRIDDPGDYPRMEVAAALRRGVRVIPVLVGKVELPKPEELPQDIVGLLDRQLVRISRERFDADVQRLLAAVAREMPENSWRDWPWRTVAAALAVTAVAAGAYISIVKHEPSPVNLGVPEVVAPPVTKSEPTVIVQKKADDVAPPAIASVPSQPLDKETVDAAGEKQPGQRPKKKPAELAHPSAAKVPPDTLKGNSTSSINVSGQWQTPILTNPYDPYHKYVLSFEFTHEGQTLFGKITNSPKGNIGRTATTGILDGKVKANSISFHTVGQVWWNDKLQPYKEMYSGILSKKTNEIEFQRFNDIPGGGGIERFVANKNDSNR